MPLKNPIDRLIGPASHHIVPPDATLVYPWLFIALLAAYAPATRVLLPFILLIPCCLLVAALLPATGGPGGLGSPARSPGLSITTRLIAQFRCCTLLNEGRSLVPNRTLLTAVQEGGSGSSASRVNQVLAIALSAVLLVAIGMTVFIVVAPDEGEKFTEFYILGPKGKAADYSTEFMSGTPQTVIIGIGNHEHREVTYTVETFAVESRLDTAKSQSTVVSATRLDRFSVTVPHNQTVEQPYTFRIEDPDTDRLEFLLFKEPPPEEIPESNLADAGYRNLHLWLRVH
ncbi:DUF1616 domain-containing protein [Methanoculleus sp.]|uniref:DUF1616 domain-containing protein n=1 Tax=Methanoculleus sp. TaxID=90427 RepID=UPI002FC8A4C2